MPAWRGFLRRGGGAGPRNRPHRRRPSAAAPAARGTGQKPGRSPGDPCQKRGEAVALAEGLNRVKAAGEFRLGKPGVDFLVTDVRPYVANAPSAEPLEND